MSKGESKIETRVPQLLPIDDSKAGTVTSYRRDVTEGGVVSPDYRGDLTKSSLVPDYGRDLVVEGAGGMVPDYRRDVTEGGTVSPDYRRDGSLRDYWANTE